jgi:hypothetical protein
LGDVAAKLESVLPAELGRELREVVEVRNFLAHHFWFERVHRMFSVDDVQRLIAELNRYRELFQLLDTRISAWSEPKHRELGLTEEVLQECQRRILAGKAGDPLPDRQTLRKLEKKLSCQQRLVRVWEFTLENGRKPLIFELADGSLWQLSDVGLGWTRFREVEPSWTEHPAVKPHLPADILPRPKASKVWEYEFTLANGAVLWVKPGKQRQTFSWGVRTPKGTSNKPLS